MTAERITAWSRLLAEIEAGRVRLDLPELVILSNDVTALVEGRSVCLREAALPRKVRRRRVLSDLAAAVGCAGNPAAAADRIRSCALAMVDGEPPQTVEMAADLATLIELSHGRVPSRTSIYEDLRKSP
ncbi:MAG: hypothetical protein GC206_17075 [Alphaproteobacteria bacterium]|nr:hypothetical protein [Alphaproteobacteria bacterium]